MNPECPDKQAGFRKGRGTRGQIFNTHWITEKAREFQKTSPSTSFTMLNPLTVWITTHCGKFLKRITYLNLPTYLLRNLYAGQEATVRTGDGTMNRFKIGKGVHQSYTLSCCLFNLYAEYIMRNARLGEA